MRRWCVLALAALLVGTPLANEAAAAPKGKTKSTVGGSWVQWANCVFTSFDPASGDFSCVGGTTWEGSWTGVTSYEIEGNLDLATGDTRGTIDETFVGTYLPDMSTGSLRFRESFTLDGATFAVHIEAHVVEGSGDPTFECSSGRATFDGLAPLVTGFGGYHGTWVHGC